jgi:hypothetical protein
MDNDPNIENPKSTDENIKDFMKEYNLIEGEIVLLREQKKDLISAFEDRLDTKTLKKAISAAKIRAKVDAVDTFDAYCVSLENEVV